MKQGTKDEVKGKLRGAAGKTKEKVGRAAGDRELEAEGRGQRAGGKVQEKVGQVKRVLDK